MLRVRWWLGTSLFLVVGCTHQNSADRSIEKLRADISKIEADRDRLDQRVGALEAAEEHHRETLAAPAPKASSAARTLPVVRVGENEARATALPPAHGEAPDLDTGSADLRPIVHASGSRGATERRGSKDGGDDATAFSPEAKRDYDAALALVRSKQFDKGLQAFTAFLVRFPDHPNAENAMYWRGECFYGTAAFARAVEEFEGLIARFPYGNKTADALLKLGLSQAKVGAKEQAEKAFAELKDRYPKSEAARQIPHP
ncbi:MAG TPA: tol-pal system protein YbgF [Polyangiaceae bacterium]|nr:tol-pal system protein YbgF [Polyangiaceae bacterium]